MMGDLKKLAALTAEDRAHHKFKAKLSARFKNFPARLSKRQT